MAAALVKGSERRNLGQQRISCQNWKEDFLPNLNRGFLAIGGNSDCPTSAKPCHLPNRYIAFLPVQPLFLVQTYQGSLGANENRRVLNMNICVSSIFAKLSTEHFLLSKDTKWQKIQTVCLLCLIGHLRCLTHSFNPSFSENVYFCKSIDPSILKGLIFASTDMTSLGAILVIGKLEGLTREGGEGSNLTFSCSQTKLFFRIMWPVRFSISDCRILLNFSAFCVSAQAHRIWTALCLWLIGSKLLQPELEIPKYLSSAFCLPLIWSWILLG